MRGREALRSQLDAVHLIHRRAAVPLPHRGEGRPNTRHAFGMPPSFKRGLLALPLGELSAQLTERALMAPLPKGGWAGYHLKCNTKK